MYNVHGIQKTVRHQQWARLHGDDAVACVSYCTVPYRLSIAAEVHAQYHGRSGCEGEPDARKYRRLKLHLFNSSRPTAAVQQLQQQYPSLGGNPFSTVPTRKKTNCSEVEQDNLCGTGTIRTSQKKPCFKFQAKLPHQLTRLNGSRPEGQQPASDAHRLIGELC